MKFSLFLILLSFTINGCTPLSTVSGIVLSENGTVENSTILAYKNFQALTDTRNAIISQTSIKPGQFTLHLAPGSYYLTATGREKHQQLFSYHGLNPITVTDSNRWLPFFAVPAKKSHCKAGLQGIGGHVFYKGLPIANGGISIYNIDDTPFRGMGLLTNTITSDGSFWFDLELGKYVLVARKRVDQSGIGPLKPGDLFCYTAANPIEVKPAQECEVDLYCYPRDDLTTFLKIEAPDPRGRQEKGRRLLSPQDISPQTPEATPKNLPKVAATITGQVRDAEGRPRPRLYVAAFLADDHELFQMYIIRFKTPFMAITDEDGRYSLHLKSGSYYLVARERLGVAPEHLEYFGLYEGSANHSLRVRPGEIRKDGDIMVGRVMP